MPVATTRMAPRAVVGDMCCGLLQDAPFLLLGCRPWTRPAGLAQPSSGVDLAQLAPTSGALASHKQPHPQKAQYHGPYGSDDDASRCLRHGHRRVFGLLHPRVGLGLMMGSQLPLLAADVSTIKVLSMSSLTFACDASAAIALALACAAFALACASATPLCAAASALARASAIDADAAAATDDANDCAAATLCVRTTCTDDADARSWSCTDDADDCASLTRCESCAALD